MASLVYRQTEAKLKPFSPGKENFAGRVCFRSASDSLSGLRVWVPTNRGSAGRCWDLMSSSCAWGTHNHQKNANCCPRELNCHCVRLFHFQILCPCGKVWCLPTHRSQSRALRATEVRLTLIARQGDGYICSQRESANMYTRRSEIRSWCCQVSYLISIHLTLLKNDF